MEWFRFALLKVLKLVTGGRVVFTRCLKTGRMNFHYTYYKNIACCAWEGGRLVDAVRPFGFLKKFMTV